MVDEPVKRGNKNTAKECSQGPNPTTDKEGLAMDEAPKILCVLENSQGETDVNDGSENPDGKDADNPCARDDVAGKGIN